MNGRACFKVPSHGYSPSGAERPKVSHPPRITAEEEALALLETIFIKGGIAGI